MLGGSSETRAHVACNGPTVGVCSSTGGWDDNEDAEEHYGEKGHIPTEHHQGYCGCGSMAGVLTSYTAIIMICREPLVHPSPLRIIYQCMHHPHVVRIPPRDLHAPPFSALQSITNRRISTNPLGRYHQASPYSPDLYVMGSVATIEESMNKLRRFKTDIVERIECLDQGITETRDMKSHSNSEVDRLRKI